MEKALFLNKIDAFIAIVTSILMYVFGEHYILFVAYLLLNVADWLTRWIAARATKTESSEKATNGFFKKFACWVLIAMSFGLTAVFIEVGEVIGIDLKITIILGWFVLVGLILNEVRSIIENLVDIPGFNVPEILIKGLEVANKAIEKAEDSIIPDEEIKDKKT